MDGRINICMLVEKKHRKEKVFQLLRKEQIIKKVFLQEFYITEQKIKFDFHVL